MFFTGCRPSEAIALQWKHIGEKFITFEQAVALSDTGVSVKRGLKTQSHRRFPINNQLQNILDSVRPENHRLDEFIFKSKQGAIIKLGNFLNHAWRGYKNRHGSHIDGIVTILAKKALSANIVNHINADTLSLLYALMKILMLKMLQNG